MQPVSRRRLRRAGRNVHALTANGDCDSSGNSNVDAHRNARRNTFDATSPYIERTGNGNAYHNADRSNIHSQHVTISEQFDLTIIRHRLAIGLEVYAWAAVSSLLDYLSRWLGLSFNSGFATRLETSARN